MDFDFNTVWRFALRSLLWGISYYFIRRAMNPEVTDLTKYRSDAMYGTLASFVAAFSFFVLDQYI